MKAAILAAKQAKIAAASEAARSRTDAELRAEETEQRDRAIARCVAVQKGLDTPPSQQR
jgi:hypothetical protein